MHAVGDPQKLGSVQDELRPVMLPRHTHAVGLGCLGTLTLPPFFYKPLSDDALFASFATVIEAVGSDKLRLYLYHIPQMTGVPITLGVIERLLKAYPNSIAGLKDSSGNWDNTASVIAAFPQIESYSASESLLVKNIEALDKCKKILLAEGYNVADLPRVIQYNKRDLPDIFPIDILREQLNPSGYPDVEASAINHVGITESLEAIAQQIMDKLAQSKQQAPKGRDHGNSNILPY